ncbi:site-specific integrase [Streptomyces fuscigenes]|uniref:site-specific integrase n=1 Tax=Streptomyces fuscigenes TaxID=1528880 RepID=UPI001F19DCF5|nr:site-specific integrase [Streptomyces fuscigenes]MCF3960586.1 site-specific integrase [Streptomyces fuscigenes]
MPGSRRAGGISKRCECRGSNGKRLAGSCPELEKRTHGRYRVIQELPPGEDGKRRRFERTGYATSKEAQGDLDRIRAILDLAGQEEDELRRVGDLLAAVQKDRQDIPDPIAISRKLGVGVPLDGKMTMGQWLEVWLDSKKSRPTTLYGYASHVRYHLTPRIGHIRLDKLNVGHLDTLFAEIEEANEVILAENQARREQEARCTRGRSGVPKADERAALAAERGKLAAMPPFRKVNGPATRQAIRRTLRTALNAAIARQYITFNPASFVELGAAARPKPLLWTPERVERWQETGEVPGSVMVWTPAQFGEFLDAAEGDRLYPIFHLMGFRGLRRGEAVGQQWTDVNLEAGLLSVTMEIVVVDGWTTVETVPKTEGSVSTISLDAGTVQVLREHRAAQLRERLACGDKWEETGKVFATETGGWLHPARVSRAFREIYDRTSLPPINLRDLRHVCATVLHAAGADLHTIKETLRHSTIVLTSNTYTSLIREVDQTAAERAAALVPRARRQVVEK